MNVVPPCLIWGYVQARYVQIIDLDLYPGTDSEVSPPNTPSPSREGVTRPNDFSSQEGPPTPSTQGSDGAPSTPNTAGASTTVN